MQSLVVKRSVRSMLLCSLTYKIVALQIEQFLEARSEVGTHSIASCNTSRALYSRVTTSLMYAQAVTVRNVHFAVLIDQPLSVPEDDQLCVQRGCLCH